MQLRIDFSGRAHRYTEEEIQAVVDAMKKAETLTQGTYLKEFESRFRSYTGAKYAFAVCNATAGLELAAQLCQFKPGDEVIMPLHTFTSSAYPFVKKGGTIVWADNDFDTRVITAEEIEKKITPKTKVVVVVHLYGYAADMEAIMKIAKKHNLLVVEDVAQAMGSEVNGRKAGTFGDIGVFSFHSHKNMTTLGEGGMLIVKNEKHANIVPMLRHNGHCVFPFERTDYWIPAMGNVDFPELNGEQLWPNNYCIGEIECALGIKLLERIDTMNAEKRTRAIRFIDALKDYPELKFHREASTRHNYHLLAACMMQGDRNVFIKKMFNEKGIKCVVQYYPLNRYPLYRKIGMGEADCPNADRFFDNMISFPFNHLFSDDDIGYILEATKDVLDQMRRK